MNIQAIYHRPESSYCFATDHKTIVLRIRFEKGEQICKLSVLYNTKYHIAQQQFKQEMQLIASDAQFDYYKATLCLDDPRLAYVFYFENNDKSYYFCEDGLVSTYNFNLAYFNSFQFAYINDDDVIQNVEWLNNAVFYQIFVDRFCKTDTAKSKINAKWDELPTPTSFYGGNLDGITENLDYIKGLGATAIYLTPIFKSNSNHKYDTIDFYCIDESFGDKESLKRLVEKAHEKGMRVVLDAVFNHVSHDFARFKDVIKKGKKSKYFDWFVIDGEKVEKNPPNYACFGDCEYMPKLNTCNKDVQNYLIVMTTVVLCFTACNKDKDEKEVVLRILENDTAKKEGYLKELLDAFNAKYASEGVKAVDANMDEFSDLEKDGPYGHGPDVLYQANDILMSYVEKHHIIPLDIEKMDCYDKIPQNAWDAFKYNYDGKTVYCGVPVNVQQPLLFYRKDALPDNWKTEWDKNGNDVPDMVEYWTEMYRYSKGIRKADRNKFGYAIELRNEYFNIGFLLSYGAYVFGNNNTDDKDIGIAKGDAVKGAKIMWELAGVMDEKCIDDSFTNGRASMLANGTIFATITTPDITSQFLKEMSLQYQKEGLDQASADAKAKENLVITGLPKLPKNGDITTQQDIKNGDLWIEQQTMGGVNGYAVSSYTKNRDWAVKFVEFATGYEMVKARADMLGVVAARSDVIAQTESLASQITYRNLDSGVLEVMPSISAVKQIWTPISSGFKQIATDGCGKRSFDTAKLQSVIEEISSNIYKAIHTFA